MLLGGAAQIGMTKSLELLYLQHFVKAFDWLDRRRTVAEIWTLCNSLLQFDLCNFFVDDTCTDVPTRIFPMAKPFSQQMKNRTTARTTADGGLL